MKLDWPTVLIGMTVALAIAVPAAILAQVLDARDSIDDNTSWQLALTGVIMIGLGAGGYQAAIRRLDTPLTHAAAAAVAAYVLVQGIGIVRLLIVGDSISWLSLPFFLLLSAACGIAGGLVADQLARRPSR